MKNGSVEPVIKTECPWGRLEQVKKRMAAHFYSFSQYKYLFIEYVFNEGILLTYVCSYKCFHLSNRTSKKITSNIKNCKAITNQNNRNYNKENINYNKYKNKRRNIKTPTSANNNPIISLQEWPQDRVKQRWI